MANIAHSEVDVPFDVLDEVKRILSLVDLSAAGLLWFASDLLVG